MWGSIPKYGWEYGLDKSAALSLNSANSSAMSAAFLEILNDGWKLLSEREPEYFEKLVKIFVKPKQDPLVAHIKILFKFLGKKRLVFIGEKKYAPTVKKLFDLVEDDYDALENETGVLDGARLQKIFRPNAMNIFFTDVYDSLKKIFG